MEGSAHFTIRDKLEGRYNVLTTKEENLMNRIRGVGEETSEGDRCLWP